MKSISLQSAQRFFLLFALAVVMTLVSCTESADVQTRNREEHAKRVKKEFLFAWDNYKKYAWGHDELKPLSKTYHDWHGQSLLMTPVDAYDTMVLMGLTKEAEEARRLIDDSLSFDKDIAVSNFEITIRLVGGLLSGYELNHDKKFFDLAVDLADRLLPAYNSPTGMPYRFVNLKTGKVSGEVSNPAEIGTTVLELGTLSKLTGNPVYYEKAKKAIVALFDRRSAIGLVGSRMNVETGKWVDSTSHISGGIDSYYEYLLKAWKLFDDDDFKKMWNESIVPVNKYLAQDVDGGEWYGRVEMNTGKIVRPYFGSLDAFFPAVLALGGDMTRAKALENSCYKMWLYYGIEPETINYTTMAIVDSPYVQRPENIESNYYLYHFTRDPEYLSRAETYFNTFIYNCKVKDGFASLRSVTSKSKIDEMPSYLLAEVFKYFYLSFAPDAAFDFDGTIFNTEAHPLDKDFKRHVPDSPRRN